MSLSDTAGNYDLHEEIKQLNVPFSMKEITYRKIASSCGKFSSLAETAPQCKNIKENANNIFKNSYILLHKVLSVFSESKIAALKGNQLQRCSFVYRTAHGPRKVGKPKGANFISVANGLRSFVNQIGNYQIINGHIARL